MSCTFCSLLSFCFHKRLQFDRKSCFSARKASHVLRCYGCLVGLVTLFITLRAAVSCTVRHPTISATSVYECVTLDGRSTFRWDYARAYTKCYKLPAASVFWAQLWSWSICGSLHCLRSRQAFCCRISWSYSETPQSFRVEGLRCEKLHFYSALLADRKYEPNIIHF